MKFLLAAVNAKYIHSNLGVYSLKAYADQTIGVTGSQSPVEIAEYTINQLQEDILKDIYLRKPAVIGFSCYIWNITCILRLVRDLLKILPETEIWLGGPEVSYHAREVLEANPCVRGVMKGEGEEVFSRLLKSYLETEMPFLDNILLEERLWDIPGLAYRTETGDLIEREMLPVMNLDKIPFCYGDLTGYEHKIIYYESSRGCPFSCSYCLSSIDKQVRFRSLFLVKEELDFFLAHKVPQVKFVDRTFNCRRGHALAVWRHILEHDNGITNFHFEISADLLGEEELELMERMRPGLIQLEIGVQSVNLDTIREIHRNMDLRRLKECVVRVNSFHNIHQHLDLIAGLPFEGYTSFSHSFNEVYELCPEQLQLGFLKVLTGSNMMEMAESYGLLFQSEPPYEVLSTKWLSYSELLKLKAVEEMVEVYYNSRQFVFTMEQLLDEFDTPFQMYEELSHYYEDRGLFGVSHNRLARYENLYDFINGIADRKETAGSYRNLLVYDLYLRENMKSRPSFAGEQSPYKTRIKEFFIRETASFLFLRGYEGYDSRQVSKMAHVEVLEDGRALLFDYRNRDPLTNNALSFDITEVF